LSAAERRPLRLAVVGAGPVGLSLALHAARSLPQAHISVFDARAIDTDVSGDPRTLAMSLGSVQLLQRLGAWPGDLAQPITEVHVSQHGPSLDGLLGDRLGRYRFNIDAEGHVADAAVAEALKGLHRFSQRVIFLGSYPRADREASVHTGNNSDGAFAAAEVWLDELGHKH
jgi:glycine/D-amino acid oxidase-like deaminating enzyme